MTRDVTSAEFVILIRATKIPERPGTPAEQVRRPRTPIVWLHVDVPPRLCIFRRAARGPSALVSIVIVVAVTVSVIAAGPTADGRGDQVAPVIATLGP